jgi:hypothetical protein
MRTTTFSALAGLALTVTVPLALPILYPIG